MQYRLNTNCPVKWTATQEKAISRELPATELSPSSAAAYVARTYQQALWLPESILPLDRVVPAMLGVPADFSQQPSQSPATTSKQGVHPLHELVKPHLLTPRLVADKYHKRIPALMDEEEYSEASPDDELMWFVWNQAKFSQEDEQISADQQAAAEEQWRQAWLNRMEQREIMIQIMLHMLLLSLPGLPVDNPASSPRTRSIDVPLPSPSPRKRIRPSSADENILSVSRLEESLEMLMDSLAMWQLMGSIDMNAGGDQSSRQAHRLTSLMKGKRVAGEDRDWMQIFCEDIVETTFKEQLPAQCSLLRSKVFQSSPFDDDSDSLNLSGTPPASPHLTHNKLQASSSVAHISSSQPQEAVGSSHRDLSRTRSLSITLEEERARARSRSLSIGPGKMPTRILAREVSMSIGFKGKGKQKGETAAGTKRAALAKSKSTAAANAKSSKAKERSRAGMTLVAATPVKPKVRGGRSTTERDVLPVIIDDSQLGRDDSRAVEGGDDDDDWVLQSTPDILLLTNDERESPEAEEVDAGTQAFFSKRGHLVEGTPTRPRRASLVRKS